MTRQRKILVIDDQIGLEGSIHHKSFLRAYSKLPFSFFFEACLDGTTYNPSKAIDALANKPDIDLVLLDILFGDDADARIGLDILPKITQQFPAFPVLVMSMLSKEVSLLAQCLEHGAVGFMRKGLDAQAFERSVEHAIAMVQSHVLLGQSEPLKELRRQVARLSPYDQIPVLVVGERGTGKERVARYIHHNGPRSQGPFVPVNCAGIPESVMEAELFGAESGSYAGSAGIRICCLEKAQGGILFLDEIGDMPVGSQSKLLRVLQEKSFRRVGGTADEIQADFQLICSTNVEPDQLLKEGKLREDFYDRVAAVTIRTPPLRDCLDDIPELVNHFIRQMGLEGKKRFSDGLLAAMRSMEWPGNVRQLQRIVQEAIVLSENSVVVDLKHLTSSHHDLSILSDGPAAVVLFEDTKQWPVQRLLTEIRMALEAKRRIQQYKGKQWKAEFMRLMYPESKAQNAKGFSDLLKRLTQGPWGYSEWEANRELALLIKELAK